MQTIELYWDPIRLAVCIWTRIMLETVVKRRSFICQNELLSGNLQTHATAHTQWAEDCFGSLFLTQNV
mgnify:CR=1 FL=1